MKFRNLYILIMLLSVFGLDKVLAEEQNNYTVLKKWSPDLNLNGEFEAERRAWLASIRDKKKEQRLKVKYSEYVMAFNQKNNEVSNAQLLPYLGK